jgi:hypothetical protein
MIHDELRKQIIVLIVGATYDEENHQNIISSGFYSELKRNMNNNYEEMKKNDEEIELFGLVNLASNKDNLSDIYEDLKLIHHLALENPKIDFKTSVDLFQEAAMHLSDLSEGSKDNDMN